MQITFYCSKCQAKLKIDAGAAGTSLDCPRCGESLTVPKAALGPGTVIGGFQIKELLGKGAMGVVYLAQQLSLNRLVALKILSHDLYQDKEQVARFLREVRVLAQLDHPNIVAAHEAGQDAGLLFLAMGYVKGMTLAEKVKLKGKINWKETCRLPWPTPGTISGSSTGTSSPPMCCWMPAANRNWPTSAWSKACCSG
jgi:serine/threonine-protein kinase